MPTYEYECTVCGNRFERRQRMKDDPLTDCPSCQGRVRRVLFPVGIVFKGSGFYVTDNRKPGLAASGEKSTAQNDGDQKSEAQSETKVEAKAEAKAETKAEASQEKIGVASGS
ncbi:MAG: hypothetical protein EPO21_00220 [Chloroflexota bacterium]|nr:MAG: hypothetical protein EPO21_00220 [Chloroflexota bacterium]